MELAAILPALRRVRWTLILLWALLCLAGWLGIARCSELGLCGERLWRLQIAWSGVSLLAVLVTTWVPYRKVIRQSYLLFLCLLAALVAVYFFPAVNGAHRWIRLGPLGFQPSEFAKIGYVLLLSRYLMYRENFRSLPGLLAPLLITMLPVLLILREPDLGTASIFLPLLLLMLYAAGARVRDLATVAFAGVLLMPILWTQMSREQRSRITAFVLQPPMDEKPSADGFHLYQAKQMILLGGWRGSAIAGQASRESSVYLLPEAATDSIFAVLGERYGIAGLAVLLGLYAALFWEGMAIARATREPFGRLAAGGVVILMGIEVSINAAMLLGLAPITGLSLPLLSYGGSGLLAHSMGIGLLSSIHLHQGYEVGPEPYRFTA